MKLKIYTYSDPYKINRESYWDEIKIVRILRLTDDG